MIPTALSVWVAVLALSWGPVSLFAYAAPDAGFSPVVQDPRLQARDGSVSATRISDEDREVLENIDLLEHLEDWKDLDLLIELSKSS